MVQCMWIPHWRFKSSLEGRQRRRWELRQWKPAVFFSSVCSAQPKRSRCNEEDHPWRWPYFCKLHYYLVFEYYLTFSGAAIIDCNGGKGHWLCTKRTAMEKCRATPSFSVWSFQVCGGFTASCPWARGLRCFLLLARYDKVIFPLWVCSMNSTAGIHSLASRHEWGLAIGVVCA